MLGDLYRHRTPALTVRTDLYRPFPQCRAERSCLSSKVVSSVYPTVFASASIGQSHV
jgi:hypothetical protein